MTPRHKIESDNVDRLINSVKLQLENFTTEQLDKLDSLITVEIKERNNF